MKRFSWHTEPGLAPHWYKIYGWLPNRYLPIVMFDSLPIYKPNRKGGHRHNHIYNACHRIVFRGKGARRVDRNDKIRFVATFYTSIMLNKNSLTDILKKKWRKNGRR